jgi:hypothetical protein
LYYLQEDLLQIKDIETGLTIDLGWYGDTSMNDGIFKIFLIEGSDWDNNKLIFESKKSTSTFSKLVELIDTIG